MGFEEKKPTKSSVHTLVNLGHVCEPWSRNVNITVFWFIFKPISFSADYKSYDYRLQYSLDYRFQWISYLV